MALNLSMTATITEPTVVNYYPSRGEVDDFAVQIMLGGTARTSLYTTVVEARQLAEAILAALPSPTEVQA